MNIINNQQYFKHTKFVKSVFDLQHLPIDNGKELAIVGRSNCGKSSLINTITNQKKLAIASKTPGKTIAINYFEIQPHKYLVDLPGYGYAKVTKNTKLLWGSLIEEYLTTRNSLIGIILLMDIRHPITTIDQQMLLFCKQYNLTTYIVLTKADQLTYSKIKTTMHDVKVCLNNLGLNSNLQIFSSFKNIGIPEMQQQIMQWLD